MFYWYLILHEYLYLSSFPLFFFLLLFFFFFKQKTAYEMRISDWSSDVCSSDLAGDSVTPLRFMIFAVVLDIVFNPVLILGLVPCPRLGIAGSALATALAGTISLAGMIGWFYAKNHVLRLRSRELSYLLPKWSELPFLIGRGLPRGAQLLVISGAGLTMVGLVHPEVLLTPAAYSPTTPLRHN